MKTSWPRVECSIVRTFHAWHSLPLVGRAERHSHFYELEAGYCHEIRPDYGCTKSMQDMSKDVDDVLVRINDQYLNDVLPVTPTAEMLACWFLAQLPAYWDHVKIHTYGYFNCRIERKYLTAEWTARLKATRSFIPVPMITC